VDKDVVVRFAPSPTGYLHVGGARTAIFNWLYAKQKGGKFILRIEDTDEERSTEESIQGIIEGLKWLGITWDEGPYFQSGFVKEHLAAAEKLIESGGAYKCFCSREELERKREEAKEKKRPIKYDGTCRHLGVQEIAEKESQGIPFAVRLKLPREGGAVSFSDVVYGTIEKKLEDLDDFVIVRSNGRPLYVLSNAVDDIRDGVTHIIRGQDGLANTPKQILIYKALGASLPEFVHMPLALDPKKAKISKRRHGELVAIQFYRENGFLPWAMVNFLVLLGWSTTDSRQIFSRKELIDAFSLEGISRSNCIFDVRKDDPKFITDPKAISINSHYLRNLPTEELAPYVKKELEKAGIWDPEFDKARKGWFLDTMELIRSRYSLLTDFVNLGRAYFSDDYPLDQTALRKNVLNQKEFVQALPLIADRLEALEDLDREETEGVLRTTSNELGIKPGTLINGMRTLVTGHAVGPGFIEVLLTLGKERVVERLRNGSRLQ
jgi:glutamyl-tRNA synthetase